jgi:hypothetical protein
MEMRGGKGAASPLVGGWGGAPRSRNFTGENRKLPNSHIVGLILILKKQFQGLPFPEKKTSAKMGGSDSNHFAEVYNDNT